MRAWSIALVLSALASACGAHHSLGFGKVVVYRNGVAYYERRAQLKGQDLVLWVPREQVDDFLKSLTVKDAATGTSLPISFPSPGSESDGLVEMAIRLPRSATTDVVLAYITAAAAWKPSYRIIVQPKGQVLLEGWAIVDNTSGEDWRAVTVGVGSSSALSFRYDLWSIRDVHRQTLATEDRFALAPPRGTSPYREHEGTVVTDLGDTEFNRPESHPEGIVFGGSTTLEGQYVVPVEDSSAGGVTLGAEGGGGSGNRGAAARAEEERRIKEQERLRAQSTENSTRMRGIASGLKSGKQKIVIEGYARPGETDPDARALDRANIVRNQLIEEGVPPAQLEARSGGVQEGRPAGVRLVAEDAPGADGPAATVDDSPVGESHFASATPLDVRRGTSVMVSIVKQNTAGEIVYLYDAESQRGNKRFAFKAVRLDNPTRGTLEAGPVTVYGEERFVGEGLADPIPPLGTALIPFALDRQIVVEAGSKSGDRIARLVKLERGALVTEVRHSRRTELKITNRMAAPARVYVRHTVLEGWELVESPKDFERIGDAHLFPVSLAANQTRTLAIEEATPMVKTLDLRSQEALDMVEVYLSDSTDHPELAAHLQTLLALHRDIANHEQAIESLRERMDDYRIRMDELHGQIVTLKAVKSGGPLMKHLQKKMEDISELVHKATIDVVDHQEGLMMARIKFQDEIAGLTLDRAVAAAAIDSP
jgi:hypothetical protein